MAYLTPSLLSQLPLNDIRDQQLPNFAPVQVVYKEFTLFGKYPGYDDIDRPTKIDGNNFDIEAFVKNIALNGYTRNPSPPVEKPENNPLDIKISRDSYVIIELDRYLGFTFTTLVDPVTQVPLEGISLMWLTGDHPDPLSHYANLRYCDDSGVLHDDPAPNCRIAFFQARKMKNAKNSYQQRIVYVMDLPTGGTRFEDPDIRFPGAGSS
ncbi:MAG: hypothetical protein JOZ90_16405 [Alphaproteobacteria bacterium]|nr:hypothetical protein [Alphaproteobacteria bacterium]MBV9372038.1 hypothetical protein [Alphaproteobacteria bacterium]MBV9902652.1 hypothetical protein [Alphaproteobacteria bacterium]